MIRLRLASPEDAPAMATIHIDAWRTAYRGIVPEAFLAALNHTQRAERFRGFIERGERNTYMVEAAGEIVGHLTIGPCRDDDLDSHETGEIWGIYLGPTHWRRGIGTHACREAEAMLGERGYRAIVLWVLAGNDAARRFYEAMGFAPDGATRTIQVGAALPVVRYRKDRFEA